MRQAAGPFIVALFSQPESLGVGQVDLSVMVEEQGSGRMLPDANVLITLTPEHARGEPIVAHLGHTSATNRLLQDALIEFPHAGRWHAVIEIDDAGRAASVATDLMVGDHSARRTTVWIFAILPVCVVVLFMWVQIVKRTVRQRKVLAQI
jgi:hypothetical protein